MPVPSLYSPTFSFPVPDFTAPITTGRTEAETLTIAAGFEVWSNPHASARHYLQANAGSSSAGGIFAGPGGPYTPSGLYDLTIGYFDETDGVSRMALVVNGAVVAEFDWDATTGTEIVTPAARAEFTAYRVAIEPGDVIELRGSADGREPLRTDYIDIVASTPLVGETLKIEAEDLEILQGFSVVHNGAASGGYMLQHTSGDRAQAQYTVQHAGLYDLTIGYFDETDGVSTLSIAFDWGYTYGVPFDSDEGSAIADRSSRRTITFENVRLEVGDTIQFDGQGDGGEPLRLDYVELTSVAPPFPPDRPQPDIWYLENRADQVFDSAQVGFNDGTGSFSLIDTFVRSYHNQVIAADVDGDGDDDFLQMQDDYWQEFDDDVEEFNFDVTINENVGVGEFVPLWQQAQRITFEMPVLDHDQPYGSYHDGVIELHDAGDVDGDGDIDLLGASLVGGSLIVFGNDGTGRFDLMALSGFEFGSGPHPARLGDFNGDGQLDALAFAAYDINAMRILLNDGTGQFHTSASMSPSTAPAGDPQIVDLDTDGDLDVVFVVGGEGRGIYAWLNDGTGHDQGGPVPRISPMGGSQGAFEVADFDGDGNMELIGAGHSQDENGGGAGLRTWDVVSDAEGVRFELKSLDPAFAGNLTAAEDYDLDGDIDVLLATETAEGTELHLLRNDGTGRFTDAGALGDPFVAVEWYWGPRIHVGYFDDGERLL
ncbi:FG-GAP-like repeat-containing protein [Salipiger sp. H15]|uniref:FG-GAP-like repeat-containing protein n=1 Tax=Alloyangia sp. H15 TaxID=3029062 RepID=A0AAU8AGC0_9RHOB